MRDQSFEDFAAEWKPLIRPEGLAEALLKAYRLGPMERHDISRLPRFFAEYDRMWLRELAMNLRKHPEIRRRIQGAEFERMHALLDNHRRTVRQSRFGADYLDSIEMIALFFLYHEVMPIWVISCYDSMKNRLLEAVQAKAMLFCDHEQLALNKGITTVALVDCTQIHRVYNCYDHLMAGASVRRRLAQISYAPAPQLRAAIVANEQRMAREREGLERAIGIEPTTFSLGS